MLIHVHPQKNPPYDVYKPCMTHSRDDEKCCSESQWRHRYLNKFCFSLSYSTYFQLPWGAQQIFHALFDGVLHSSRPWVKQTHAAKIC